MLNVILVVIGSILFVVGMVHLVDRFLPPKVKPFLIVLFGVISIFLGYLIYGSVNDPIKFDKIKVERYTEVINRFKDIRESQLAYKTVTGKFANDFNGLIQFIDTAKFTLVEKRDSSFMRMNKVYRIEMPVDTVLIDTLGFVPIKDSLFGASDRYKKMMDVPAAKEGSKFVMKSDIIDKSGYKVAVFEAKVDKNLILHDQPDYLVRQERELISVDGVNGPEIVLGSLTDVSTNGNWPTLYDTKDN